MTHAIALYRFDAVQPGDLSFETGDHVIVIDQGDTGWWFGRTDDGRQGIFPFNRVQVQAVQPGMPARPLPTAFVVDRINRVDVTAVEPIPKFNQKFLTVVVLSSSKEITGEKSMKDFRILNAAINILQKKTEPIRGYDRAERRETDVPEWADNIKLPPQFAAIKMKDRAHLLMEYLMGVTGESSVEYLMVYWLNPNATFQLQDNEKRRVEEAYRTAYEALKKSAQKPDPVLARALYKWTKRDDQDTSFIKGEILAMQEDTDFTGWWMGEKVNGDRGLFPYNYVEKLSPTEAGEILHPELQKETPKMPEMTPIKKEPVPTPIDFNPGLVLESDIGLGGRFDKNEYKNTVSQVFTKPGNNVDQPRARQKISKYSLCCTEAFDELLTNGVTLEANNELFKSDPNRDTPKPGDTVTLFYSGFIWEPQKQDLLEFASSDKLISNNNPNSRPGPLVFTIGSNQAIDGIEEAVQKMYLGQETRVTLTPEKAYGEVGFPPDIPGNAYLVYDLTLKDVKRAGRSDNVGVNANGAARPMVQARKRDDNGFVGAKSMREIGKAQKDQEKKRVQNFGFQEDPGVDENHFKKKLTLEKLQNIVKNKQFQEYNIQPGLIEEYLTEEEFFRAFNVDHSMWLLMPAYKRKVMKEKVGLY